eukprot:5373717-Pyramimonas_sp.AAC.1
MAVARGHSGDEQTDASWTDSSNMALKFNIDLRLIDADATTGAIVSHAIGDYSERAEANNARS